MNSSVSYACVLFQSTLALASNNTPAGLGGTVAPAGQLVPSGGVVGGGMSSLSPGAPPLTSSVSVVTPLLEGGLAPTGTVLLGSNSQVSFKPKLVFQLIHSVELYVSLFEKYVCVQLVC